MRSSLNSVLGMLPELSHIYINNHQSGKTSDNALDKQPLLDVQNVLLTSHDQEYDR